MGEGLRFLSSKKAAATAMMATTTTIAYNHWEVETLLLEPGSELFVEVGLLVGLIEVELVGAGVAVLLYGVVMGAVP